MTKQLPRPVRNNNPLDINSGPMWLGLMPESQMTQEQREETRFAVFKSPVWGFRAGAVLLRNYGKIYGVRTLEGLVSRLAPASENNTRAYIAAMEHWTGFEPKTQLDLEDPQVLGPLLRGFAMQEAGDFDKYWLESQIDTALAMLGASAGAGTGAKERAET